MQDHQPQDIHSESFLRSLILKQLRLSILCAAMFLLMLVGLPLANFFLPELMSMRIGGFTLSWLLLGVGFFPAVWFIAWVFIRRSIRLENSEVANCRMADESLTETSLS